MSAKEYVKKVKEDGGLGFIAHPHEKRTHMKEHPPYPWIEWDTEDFTGIEIWNHMSEWMENLTEKNKYQSFIHPLKTIEAPPAETIKLWDQLNTKRKVVGIGGVDAHAHKYNLLGFVEVEIFPYKVLFKSIRTHILLNEKIEKGRDQDHLKKAKDLVYGALHEGRCFIANDYHGNSTGFKFFAESGRETYQMGEELKRSIDTVLKVISPQKAEIRLFRSGKKIETIEGDKLEYKVVRKGVFRAEVYLNNKAWIFSNHIRII
jgi:hypothetical protein